ncbi:MAG: hypothetical protein HY828_14835 [Actinobacteria bacterium]|nr:hypothetical protein [Actinomycetota bacterium]
MDLGSSTVVDEQSLVECVNRSIGAVHRYVGLLTGGDRARTEQILLDVYTSVAHFARKGPCRVPFEQLCVAGRRQFVADGRAVARGAQPVEWTEATVVDSRGEALLLPEVDLYRPLLADIPDLERAVLVFHRVEGLSNDEIAAELDVSQRRVGVLLRRGLRRIGVRHADAVHADVMGFAGTPLEPSSDIMFAVRRLVVGEWRGEPTGRASRHRVGVPRRLWVGAAAAVAAVFVGVAWSGAVSVARSEPEPPLTAVSTTMCPGHVSTRGLATVGFAFDGDVVDTFAGTDLAGGPVRAVTFDVRRWHRGEVQRRLTVRWRSDVQPRPGMRMLVSGGESDGVPVVWGCGYSLERTDLDAAWWHSVLDQSSTGATLATEKAAQRRHDG